MKITHIEITNMHDMKNGSFDINSDLTYFHGLNGAGKTTILQATQLAILGYIPGYGKRKQDIMKHATAGQNTMKVRVDFDQDCSIERIYVKKKDSVSETTVANPSDFDPSIFVSKVESPVFNFNSFLGLSANDQKKWFLEFLPGSTSEIDWKTQMKDAVADNLSYREDYFNEVSEDLESIPMTSDTVKNLKAMHAKIKEYTSFVNGQIKAHQSSINDLVYYDTDEIIPDESKIRADIDSYEREKRAKQDLLTRIRVRESQRAQKEQQKADLQLKYSDLSEKMKEDSKWAEFSDAVKKVEAEYQILLNNKTVAEESYNTLCADLESENAKVKEAEKSVNKLSAVIPKGNCCPYTKQECETVREYVSTAEEALEKAKARLDKVLERRDKVKKEYDEKLIALSEAKKAISDYPVKLNAAQNDLTALETRYRNRDALLAAIDSSVEEPTDSFEDMITLEGEYSEESAIGDINFIDEQIKNLRNQLTIALANKKYNELHDKLTAEMMKDQQNLDMLKAWDKLFGPNGLQNEAALAPFMKLKEDLTIYIQRMFGEKTSAWFNLSEKSNSFDFGIEREHQIIPFETLSSGEKCMYMLSMLTCISSLGVSPLKFICIDDAFDHLDESNLAKITNFCESSKDIQFIFAGVANIAGKYTQEVQ